MRGGARGGSESICSVQIEESVLVRAVGLSLHVCSIHQRVCVCALGGSESMCSVQIERKSAIADAMSVSNVRAVVCARPCSLQIEG